MNPWDKGYKPSRLNRELYSLAQVFAAEGRLPADHAAWRQTEATEARYIGQLVAAAQPLPDFKPPSRGERHGRESKA